MYCLQEHYFNPKSGNDRGFIENRLLTMRKILSPTKKKYVVKNKKQQLVPSKTNLVKGIHATDDNMERMVCLNYFFLKIIMNIHNKLFFFSDNCAKVQVTVD